MARQGSQATLATARVELRRRLEGRRGEIEEAIRTRVHAIAEAGRETDPAYRHGLRSAAAAALEYGLTAVERGEHLPTPLPTELLAQARLAQRHGIGLEIVLRRYFAGYALFTDFLVEEAEKAALPGDALKRLLRSQAIHLDRLIAAVSDEYAREAQSYSGSSERRRAERIERLLGGELVDTADFAYDFEGFHLALVASGPRAVEEIRTLAGLLDRRLLLIRPDADVVWAWFGGRRPLDPTELLVSAGDRRRQLALATGEPGEGLGGWRLSHRQAVAALPVARRGVDGLARYADVALVASVLQDEMLAASLRQLYLEPLDGGPGEGKRLRETLRAYFAHGRNVSSAAAALGVNRNTVASRLRTIEELLCHRLEAHSAGIEVALRLEELDEPASCTVLN